VAVKQALQGPAPPENGFVGYKDAGCSITALRPGASLTGVSRMLDSLSDAVTTTSAALAFLDNSSFAQHCMIPENIKKFMSVQLLPMANLCKSKQ
jgi:hypothetical protein